MNFITVFVQSKYEVILHFEICSCTSSTDGHVICCFLMMPFWLCLTLKCCLAFGLSIYQQICMNIILAAASSFWKFYPKSQHLGASVCSQPLHLDFFISAFIRNQSVGNPICLIYIVGKIQEFCICLSQVDFHSGSNYVIIIVCKTDRCK